MGKQIERLWVVVKVASGIPVMVKGFKDLQLAEKRDRLWRNQMHPESDETGVFEIQVTTATNGK